MKDRQAQYILKNPNKTKQKHHLKEHQSQFHRGTELSSSRTVQPEFENNIHF